MYRLTFLFSKGNYFIFLAIFYFTISPPKNNKKIQQFKTDLGTKWPTLKDCNAIQNILLGSF